MVATWQLGNAPVGLKAPSSPALGEAADVGRRPRYHDGLSAHYLGADPEVLEEMTVNFYGALLLEMERLGLLHATHDRAGHA